MLGNTKILSSCVAILLVCGQILAGVAESPLADAAMRGDLDAVQSLLQQKADVNTAQGDGATALHWAAHREDVEMARLLIAAGADVRATTRLGDLTPIHMAAKIGSAEIIRLLIEAGVDPNTADTNGTTPLMYTAAAGRQDAVRVLIESGAGANAKDIRNGQTALMFAAAQGWTEIVRMLAAHHADVNATTTVTEVIKWSDRFRDDEGNLAVREKRDELFMGGLTALHFAAREGHLETVKELAASGANVNIIAASDNTSPLTMAIINGRLDVALFLVENGADPNAATKDGVAPLYATVDAQWAERTWYPAPSVEEEQTNHLTLLKALLDRGADPNHRLIKKPRYRTGHGDWIKPAGATALWLAAKANDVPAMKLLAAAGANPSIPAKSGATALLAASGFGLEPQVTRFAPGARLAAVRYLVEELGADVNGRDIDGYTPLHGAALTTDHDVILYLVSMGADIQARASMVFGGVGESDKAVEAMIGDTVADMANGPKAHNMQYPETVRWLEQLGSENSNNCRASTCVVKTLGR